MGLPTLARTAAEWQAMFTPDLDGVGIHQPDADGRCHHCHGLWPCTPVRDHHGGRP